MDELQVRVEIMQPSQNLLHDPSKEIKSLRYKSIILGKNGETIKKIRKTSQKEIQSIFNSKCTTEYDLIPLF